MKKITKLFLILITLFLCSCGQKQVVPETKWGTDGKLITYDALTGKNLNGKFEFTDVDGWGNNYVSKVANFKKGLYHGECKEYISGGGLVRTITFKKGVLDGKFEGLDYAELGLPGKFVKTAMYKDDEYDGKVTWYYTDYHKTAEYTYDEVTLKMAKTGYKGIMGGKAEEAEYKNGVLDGTTKRWYQNGNLMSEMSYKNDKIFGEVKIYDENGNLQKKYTYKDEKLDGLYEEYQNGNLFIKGKYSFGKKVGKWRIGEGSAEFDNEGKLLKSEVYFSNETTIGKETREFLDFEGTYSISQYGKNGKLLNDFLVYEPEDILKVTFCPELKEIINPSFTSNIQKNTYITKFYENGNIKEMYYVGEQDPEDGPEFLVREFYENGMLAGEIVNDNLSFRYFHISDVNNNLYSFIIVLENDYTRYKYDSLSIYNFTDTWSILNTICGNQNVYLLEYYNDTDKFKLKTFNRTNLTLNRDATNWKYQFIKTLSIQPNDYNKSIDLYLYSPQHIKEPADNEPWRYSEIAHFNKDGSLKNITRYAAIIFGYNQSTYRKDVTESKKEMYKNMPDEVNEILYGGIVEN